MNFSGVSHWRRREKQLFGIDCLCSENLLPNLSTYILRAVGLRRYPLNMHIAQNLAVALRAGN